MKKSWLLLVTVCVFTLLACGGGDTKCTSVGPEGGTVQGPEGVVLVVPAGALTQETSICVRESSRTGSGFLPATATYEIRPHDLQFLVPAELSVQYLPAAVAGDASELELWTTDSSASYWTPRPGTVNTALSVVTTPISQVSYVALGTPDPNCVPLCGARTCGPDGCGEECAPGCTGATPDCDETTWTCTCIPDCVGRECGSDGCGGFCGTACIGAPCDEGTGRCPACGNGVCDFGENNATCDADCPVTRDVDLLFVIDNGPGIIQQQMNFRAQLPELVSALEATPGGLPNLHVGVTTTDIGLPIPGMFCSPTGDQGQLLTGTCPNPTGAPYVVDVAPEGCTIDRQPDGTCTSHDCTVANCAAEPTASLEVDATTACPRCRNYQGETLDSVLSCLADRGDVGCPYEQQLEAMYLALDPGNTANAGFERSSSVLAVVIVTSEDDCSASLPLQLFDNTETSIDSPYGCLSSFRCFEFGVSCDVNDRTQEGMRHNCLPRSDAGALLHLPSRYTSLLRSLRDPGRIVVAIVGGPATASSGGVGFDANVYMDENACPELSSRCGPSAPYAGPGIRLHAFASAFNSATELSDWAFANICSSDYTASLQGLAQKIATAIQ